MGCSSRGVTGVINVQHRDAHSHSGGEMELLTTVGEQLGCLLELSLVLSRAGPVEMALTGVTLPVQG